MESCLQIGCRAEWKAFLAVPALLRGYFRNEIDLPTCSSVNKSNSIFLFDFSTVSYTQTTKNAKWGLFLKASFVCSGFLGQIHQRRGIKITYLNNLCQSDKILLFGLWNIAKMKPHQLNVDVYIFVLLLVPPCISLRLAKFDFFLLSAYLYSHSAPLELKLIQRNLYGNQEKQSGMISYPLARITKWNKNTRWKYSP